MTAIDHLQIQQIADLRAGLLRPDPAAEVSAHLADCAACTQTAARLESVSMLLADEGGRPISMPDHVAESIDAAISQASTDRAAGVSSLADRRTTAATSPTHPPRRWAPLLLGAAATVVALAAGGAILHNGLTGSGSTDNTAGANADQRNPEDEPNAVAAPKSSQGGGAAADVPSLTKDDVVRYARELSSQAPAARVPRDCPALSTDIASVDALVSFDGRRAALRLDELARTVTVVSCSAETRVLFRHGY